MDQIPFLDTISYSQGAARAQGRMWAKDAYH